MIPKRCRRPARIFSQNLGLTSLEHSSNKSKQSLDFFQFFRGFRSIDQNGQNPRTNGWPPDHPSEYESDLQRSQCLQRFGSRPADLERTPASARAMEAETQIGHGFRACSFKNNGHKLDYHTGWNEQKKQKKQ